MNAHPAVFRYRCFLLVTIDFQQDILEGRERQEEVGCRGAQIPQPVRLSPTQARCISSSQFCLFVLARFFYFLSFLLLTILLTHSSNPRVFHSIKPAVALPVYTNNFSGSVLCARHCQEQFTSFISQAPTITL